MKLYLLERTLSRSTSYGLLLSYLLLLLLHSSLPYLPYLPDLLRTYSSFKRGKGHRRREGRRHTGKNLRLFVVTASCSCFLFRAATLLVTLAYLVFRRKRSARFRAFL